MTQDEVDLIYEYLHENYEYRDGDLYRIKSGNGWPNGHKFGKFMHANRNSSCLTGQVSIDGKKYQWPLSHFIFLFHRKIKCRFIKHIDGNKTNTSIENLIESDPRHPTINKFHKAKGYTIKIKNGRKLFEVKILFNYKTIYLGSYECEDTAMDIYKNAKTILDKININEEIFKAELKDKCPKFFINPVSNKTGFRGVIKSRNKFMYKIRKKGATILSKTYSTPQEAHEAYLKAKQELSRASEK